MNKVVDIAENQMSEPLTVGAEAYISEEYARAERDRLWRKVWQQVGRVEEIPEVGNFLTYEILDDSIIVVRTAPDRIAAYHNVCPHRGRRLVDTPAERTIHSASGLPTVAPVTMSAKPSPLTSPTATLAPTLNERA
jgi:hypothetical protein